MKVGISMKKLSAFLLAVAVLAAGGVFEAGGFLEAGGVTPPVSAATEPAPVVAWAKNFGGAGAWDYFNDVASVSDGYIAVGHSYFGSFGNGDWVDVTAKGSGAYNIDAVIVKFDSDGNVMWKKNFGGAGNDQFMALATVSDGYVAVGESNRDSLGNGDWDDVTRKGNWDATIVKFDLNGNVVWKNNFGGSDVFYAVSPTSDGYVAVGQSYAVSNGTGDWADVTGKGDADAIIVKFDLDGDVIWKKNFGGVGHDCFHAVTAVSDGYVTAGYSNSESFGNGDWSDTAEKEIWYDDDAVIVKFDLDGNVVWKRNFGGLSYDFFYGMAVTADGFVAVGYAGTDSSFETGYFDSEDAIIVKFDLDGYVVWESNFGGSSYNYFNAVTVVSDGYIAVGFSDYESFGTGDWSGVLGNGGSDAIIIKYDLAGDVVWRKNFGGVGTDWFNAVVPVSNRYVVIGASYSDSFGNGDWSGITGHGGFDAVIVKFVEPFAILAAYDDENALVDCVIAYDPDEFDSFEPPPGCTKKVFYWESLANIKPMK